MLSKDLKDKIILLAEDDESLAKMYKMAIELAGGHASVAGNGEEALNMLQLEKVDAILLDLMMPKMNGYEVFRRMKENDKLKNIPIIILTNLDEHPEYIEKTAGAKADEYLVKSNVTVEEVINKLAAHIK